MVQNDLELKPCLMKDNFEMQDSDRFEFRRLNLALKPFDDQMKINLIVNLNIRPHGTWSPQISRGHSKPR